MTDQQFAAVLLHLRIIIGLLGFTVGILLGFAWEYL
jgi:ABC-type antimicrobial peptide transport system permease subunit